MRSLIDNALLCLYSVLRLALTTASLSMPRIDALMKGARP